MSWRSQEIGIELTLDLQNDLVEQETHERLEERDQAIYEDMASLDQRLDLSGTWYFSNLFLLIFMTFCWFCPPTFLSLSFTSPETIRRVLLIS